VNTLLANIARGGSQGDAEPQREGLLVRGYGRIEIPSVAILREWVADRSELSPVG
jgi:hypothetical protein